MSFYFDGDKSQAICEHCKKRVTTTFTRRDVPFDDGSGVAKDILTGICDLCDSVVTIPHQSVPAIKRSRHNATETFEVKLEPIYLDALDAAIFKVYPTATPESRKHAFMHFALHHHELLAQSTPVSDYATLGSALRERKAAKGKRWSMKLSKPHVRALDALAVETRTKTRTELTKHLIDEMKFLVVDKADPRVMSSLKQILEVTG